MIRMIQSRSSGHAKAYFSESLAKADYYISGQELSGFWGGKLASRLGLNGKTEKEDFFALCENAIPRTGEALTPRNREDRTTGYDINFHCPKSVSVLHVLSGDDHILKVFQESVTETMEEIEADSKTRVRKGGKSEDRDTGELAWAHFIHQTARPVEGKAPDPHLHSHCFVFNATWDGVEGKIKAGQFREIKRDMPYYQARFQKRLSDKLMDLGYGIKRTQKGFEVENVPHQVIDLFSKRTDEIGRVAKEKGITNAKELGELGAKTRSAKQKGRSMEELKKDWLDQIKAVEKSNPDGWKGKRDFEPSKDQPIPDKGTMQDAKACLDHALLHCFERASVMDGKRILETAYKQSMGVKGVRLDEITKAFNSDQRIIGIVEKGRTVCTTKEVLREEKEMVDLAKAGMGKVAPLYQEVPLLGLKGQQAFAIAHVLTTNHRVSIIRGAAGAGKTSLMKEAVSHMEKAGKTVTVVAPTAQASRGVLKEEGFQHAETVARFLTDPKMQEKIKGQVLWVDEAGLLGTKDMTSLLKVAEAQNARLILGGDTRQHASVVRGDALRILNTVAGIKSAEVSKIYRQRNEEYKSAVEDLSKGKVESGFQKLDQAGFIQNIDPLSPNQELVKDYVETIRKGKTALVISPTHAQGEAVTNQIREELRHYKLIGKKEITIHKLDNLNLTEAEKADFRNFRQGQFIQFNQNTKGIQRGSLWQIQKVDKGKVIMKDNKGKEQPLPLKESQVFEVFQEKEMQLSKGDKIRITRNGFDKDKKRLNNGQILDVVSVTKTGKIKLASSSGSSFTLDKAFGHLTHAHCITSYAAQGKTVDEVFIAQPASTFGATDAKQFYVSVSRGRDRARIYTDDKEALLHFASEMGDRQSALELLKRKELEKEIAHIQQVEKQKPVKQKLVKSKQREDYEPEI